MADRSSAQITIGGAVRRRGWRDVEDALTSAFGKEYSLLVLRPEAKALKKANGPELVAANTRYEEELKRSRRSPPFAWVSIPLKKLDRLVGITLSFTDHEVAGGRFDDLQQALRDGGVSYLVESDGYDNEWPAAWTWWMPDDPEREKEGFGPFYNTNGERYIELVKNMRDTREMMDAEQVLAAFKIARREFEGVELPPGPDLGDAIVQRVVNIGSFVPQIPPLSILE